MTGLLSRWVNGCSAHKDLLGSHVSRLRHSICESRRYTSGELQGIRSTRHFPMYNRYIAFDPMCGVSGPCRDMTTWPSLIGFSQYVERLSSEPQDSKPLIPRQSHTSRHVQWLCTNKDQIRILHVTSFEHASL